MRKSAELTEELAKKVCDFGPESSDGKEIGILAAIEAISDFIAINGDCDVRAFHLGLSTLQSMLDKANSYNGDSPEFPIVGFRFYQAITSRSFPDGPEIEKKEDLVAFPTLSNGDNHANPIISHTRPCPKLCDPLGPLRLTHLQ